jgi:tetratricopeptide (TPR) repeat protein
MSDSRAPSVQPRRRRDQRLSAIVLVVLGTALVGYLISLAPGRGVSADAHDPKLAAARADLRDLAASASGHPPRLKVEEEADAAQPEKAPATEAEKIMQAAKAHIRAKRYDAAIATLHEAREVLKPDLRAYMLMANALEARKDYDTARDFYGAVIDRDPWQADAYWGVATTSESMGELDAAVGAMRNFLHVQPNADPQKLRIVQARSALWEWESKLGRGPWGPTKGIPPGFTEEELRRDGDGVGIKIPLLETRKADGTMKYEVKSQHKFQLFKP